jgi:hypothetical protein
MTKTRSVTALGILTLIALGFAFAAGVHPLAKASFGDWVQFTVNIKNETEPLLSVEDQQRWRAVSVVLDAGVRIDNYSTMAGSRTGMGGSICYFDKPYEAVTGISTDAKIEIVSTTPDNVTIKGKALACTKVVRKVTQPVSAETFQSGWNGMSTIWLCPDIPVGGLVKVENRYQSQLTADSAPNKIVETWFLTDFGFKNWKE